MIFIITDTVIVISDGLTAASPHASYYSWCEYSDAAMNEFAEALCRAQGFAGGKFLNSSNDYCKKSFTSDFCYVYLLDRDMIEYHDCNYHPEAQITAMCQLGNGRHQFTY